MIEDNVFNITTGSGDGAVIYCFGDEQRGAAGFAKYDKRGKAYGPGQECFDEMVYQFKREKVHRYALHLGDGWDWLRPTMRARIEAPLVHDTSARAQLDVMVRKAQDRELKDYSPFEGRMIGCHEGHHSWKFMEGMTTDQRLASSLKARYLGWIGLTRLRIQREGVKSGTNVYLKHLLSTHGQGNARAAGSDARYINELAGGIWSDIYVRGHSCKALCAPGPARRIPRTHGPPGIIKTTPWYVNTPGMCEGYTNGWESTYAERAGYVPQPLGWCVIRIKIVQRLQHDRDAGIIHKKTGPKNKKRAYNIVDIQANPVIFTNDPT